MPISKNKVEAIEKTVAEFFPDTKIHKTGKHPDGSCKEIFFYADSIVGSFLRQAFNISTSFIIKPTRSLQVEMIFN